MAARRSLIALALGAAVLAGPAWAECHKLHQYPVEAMDREPLRDFLIGAKREVERFFDLRLGDLCLDDQEAVAYYWLPGASIMLGRETIRNMANPPGNLNHVIAALAHETAHAYQHKNGFLEILVETDPHRVKCIELHADFMAGAFMAWRGQRFEIDPERMAKMFFGLGDGRITYQGHHGLQWERYVSFLQGYRTKGIANFRTNGNDILQLSTLGSVYVSRTNCD